MRTYRTMAPIFSKKIYGTKREWFIREWPDMKSIFGGTIELDELLSAEEIQDKLRKPVSQKEYILPLLEPSELSLEKTIELVSYWYYKAKGKGRVKIQKDEIKCFMDLVKSFETLIKDCPDGGYLIDEILDKMIDALPLIAKSFCLDIDKVEIRYLQNLPSSSIPFNVFTALVYTIDNGINDGNLEAENMEEAEKFLQKVLYYTYAVKVSFFHYYKIPILDAFVVIVFTYANYLYKL